MRILFPPMNIYLAHSYSMCTCVCLCMFERSVFDVDCVKGDLGEQMKGDVSCRARRRIMRRRRKSKSMRGKFAVNRC